MEIRKESLSALKVCRFCLSEDETITSLYERNRAPKNPVPLTLKILSNVSIEVFPSDRMPCYICSRCKFFMDLTYDYKQICRQADESLLQFVQNGSTLKSISWPAALTKLYKSCNKTSVMKTIVEGGATVQVTAQDTDSDEADDENVYNIKITDGSEISKGARIKVITSDKGEKEGKDPESPVSERQSGSWPCNECDCNYPLQQLLDLHKSQKHRERNVHCDKCDAKFYTSYDLVTHQLRHTNDMQFQCVACDKPFKRHILLKRHEKVVHSDLPQQPCALCPATFLSLEELEAHKKKHVRIITKLHECDICNKRFKEKATLRRHKGNVHNKEPTFACEYCPSRFSSVTKLARHVREHAGDRPYPCKYCDKAFMKSHHYTRHLRQKHREMNLTSQEPEMFRCEECEDSFTSQDDLIYHSAIHATQNLTCPLCQEKFDDVDAVTAHIKSHVNGTEFMCDFCELIFTSKEKLNNHMALSHEDELNEQELTQDESSMEVDQEDDEDDPVVLKERDDHMLVEIKKPDEFMLKKVDADVEAAVDNTNSEESETEATYTELATVDTLAMVQKESTTASAATLGGATLIKNVPNVKATGKKDAPTASILRKVDECKKKSLVMTPELDKKEKPVKPEVQNSASGGNDKSLRLLEKELQELKRTNTRSEPTKTPAKLLEPVRSRRLQIHTSTPKPRTPTGQEEKKVPPKPAVVEKKTFERRAVTKENKEPKDTKEVKTNNVSAKEDKEKETPKTIVKNGSSEKTPEEGIRRSTRPSKIKDYAKMIRDRSQESEEEEESDEGDDVEYKEAEKLEVKKMRRVSVKSVKPVSSPAQSASPSPAVRKRGRPRKEPLAVPNKVRKDDTEEEDTSITENIKPDIVADAKQVDTESNKESDNKSTPDEAKPSEKKPSVLMSPTGQTLKKIPIKSLPPGVKPLPLPPRTVNTGEVCEMQIGKKVVKVQKIVMTKAEVEAMAKKGLVEMKDGTMVLKQGIKIPTSDASSLKTSLNQALKESPSKKEKAAPTRCDLGDDLG